LKKLFLHSIFIFLILAFFGGCSTEKNTRVSRAFHNLTSHYNIYFNANESVKKGLINIEEQVENDYTHILPVYKESDGFSASIVKSDMDYAVVKCTKLIESHSITKKPKRRKRRTRRYKEFASKEEFNKWIDDSYLLMGRAYFYEHSYRSAVSNFSYVVRKYPKEETAALAQVYLIRAYSELEQFIEANEVIQAVQNSDIFPQKYERDLALATADYYIKQKEYREAIRMLEIAINKIPGKRKKSRYQYIIAQLYEALGQNEKSLEAFRKVIRLNPDYAMAFNARIKSAEVFSGGGNSKELRKELNKMLRDKKNIDFRDQIYYALGNLFFREGSREQAKDSYRESVALSVKNRYQRALSALTLADLYFEDLNYRGSQLYYDSAMIIIDNTYPDYERLQKRYKSLSGLVNNLLTVEREDSLQRVALMSEPEREELIARLIKSEKEQQKALEIPSKSSSTGGYYNASRLKIKTSSSSWYFYNAQTVTYGQSIFKKKWGNRRLEDNWRRSNKTSVATEEELVEKTKEADESREEDPLKKGYYTQYLPLTDSLMAISNERIRDALYNAGKIFKSDFVDYPRAAETFEELNRRFPDNIYLLSACFDLYDLYELMGNKEQSAYYRNLLVSRYPESKYAQYLLNPNFFIEMEAQKDKLNQMYRETFRNYKRGHYQNVIGLTTKLKQLKPDSLIIPKIDFMQMVAKGTQTDVHQFEALLKAYLLQYPQKEPSPLAQEILSLIQDSTLADYQKLVEMGYLNEEIKNEELLDETGQDDEFDGKFSYEEDLLHYFVIVYPIKEEKKIDLNRLKFDLANYNIDHYTKIDYDIETDILNDEQKFIVVRAMQNKENALIYHGAVIRNAAAFRELKGIDYKNFVISSTNYRTVKSEKSIADYLKFFVKNYSRFIRSNFSDDGAEISPEELMARAAAENEALKEKGSFVSINTGASVFDRQIDTTQNFVLAVKDKKMSLRQLFRGFADFNKANFKAWRLKINVKQANDYQLMVVSGIPALNESMSYFRSVVIKRSLFKPLGQATYRNFLITDENLQTLIDKNKVDEYITFFRSNYIKRPQVQAGSSPVKTTQKNGTSKGTEQAAPDEYSGIYDKNIETSHKVLFVITKEGGDKAAFINEIKGFSSKSFENLNVEISEHSLDDFRNLVIVSGFNDQATARRYLGIVIQNRDLFVPLGKAEYRNFLISDKNFNIFLKEKNIKEYMDFYKMIYLERKRNVE